MAAHSLHDRWCKTNPVQLKTDEAGAWDSGDGGLGSMKSLNVAIELEYEEKRREPPTNWPIDKQTPATPHFGGLLNQRSCYG